jgi:hypothetical protein
MFRKNSFKSKSKSGGKLKHFLMLMGTPKRTSHANILTSPVKFTYLDSVFYYCLC